VAVLTGPPPNPGSALNCRPAKAGAEDSLPNAPVCPRLYQITQHPEVIISSAVSKGPIWTISYMVPRLKEQSFTLFQGQGDCILPGESDQDGGSQELTRLRLCRTQTQNPVAGLGRESVSSLECSDHYGQYTGKGGRKEEDE
jgi:hypothetical protein